MRKIKLVHMGLAALLLSSIIACNSDEPEVAKLDFTIVLPENWTGTTLANEGLVYAAGRNLQGENDTVAELLYVVKEYLPGSQFSLNTYYNLLFDKIDNPRTYVSQIYASDTVINDVDYKKLVSREILRYANPGYDSIELDVITDRYFCYFESNGYNMVFFSVDTLYFKQNRAIFNSIMNSIDFNN